MKHIILNERLYAEDCLENTIVEERPHDVLPVLAKYYYHKCGYRKKKIIRELTDYMIQRFPDYIPNRVHWDMYIESVASRAGKCKLYEIDGVKVTQSEMDAIDKLSQQKLQKVAFTYLCLAKLGNKKNPSNNNWVSIEPRDVFKYAHVSGNTTNRGLMLSKLNAAGLLSFAKKNTNLSCRVEFIDDSSTEILFVSDFRELGYEYLFFKGKDYFRCAECGILTRKTVDNKGLYCKNCASQDPPGYKRIKCIDCGTEFLIPASNRRTIRCGTCESWHRKEYKSAWYQSSMPAIEVLNEDE